MKVTALLCFLLLLQACAGQATKPQPRPANDNNYETDFRYPEVTEHYVLQQKVIYPDPALGVMLRYQDRRLYGDWITVYVYPINAINWDEPQELLEHHIQQVVAEIDQAIAQGIYKARTPAEFSDFNFSHEGREFSGKKARMKITQKNNKLLDSDAYLFIGEDKYIKFRTSFDPEFTPDWTGDDIVREILPGIVPPPESEYLRELRDAHRQQMASDLMKAILASKKER